MRGAIVGSSLVHLVLLVALLAVRHGSSIQTGAHPVGAS